MILIAAILFAFAFMGALPPLLRRISGWRKISQDPACWRDRVVGRYQKVSTFAWMFSYWKLRLDPLCGELHNFLKTRETVQFALDIGCGYGIPGCSLLEWFPEAKIFGIDPLASRIKVAARAFGARGDAAQKAAPDIDVLAFPPAFDVVFVNDVIHFLTDEELDVTLRKIRSKLGSGGHLYIRAIIPPCGPSSLLWKLYNIKQRGSGESVHYRSVDCIREKLSACGFEVNNCMVSGGNPEMVWFMAVVCEDLPSEKSDAKVHSL